MFSISFRFVLHRALCTVQCQRTRTPICNWRKIDFKEKEKKKKRRSREKKEFVSLEIAIVGQRQFAKVMGLCDRTEPKRSRSSYATMNNFVLFINVRDHHRHRHRRCFCRNKIKNKLRKILPIGVFFFFLYFHVFVCVPLITANPLNNQNSNSALLCKWKREKIYADMYNCTLYRSCTTLHKMANEL